MGNPAGVKRDFDALEKRRFQALHLLEGDLNQAEVARRLHVARQTISRWMQEYRADGEVALNKAGRVGRKPQLTAAQLQRLQERLIEGTETLGYETPLWTCTRVTHLINDEFGVDYHPGHVWKILRAMGWSCRRPNGRAWERNEEEIRRWRRVRWPTLKKSPPGSPDDHLHRRKRSKRTPAPLPYLGTARPDAGSAVQLQLEDNLGHRRHHLLELLLPPLSGNREEP
jgi:transposase